MLLHYKYESTEIPDILIVTFDKLICSIHIFLNACNLTFFAVIVKYCLV